MSPSPTKSASIAMHFSLRNTEQKQQADKAAAAAMQARRQDEAEERAWRELTLSEGKPLLDRQRLAAFPAAYASAVEQFEPAYEKLAQAHAAWLKSEQLANWMDGVHDAGDIRSGHAYSKSLAQCIGKAVATQPLLAAPN
jgi:hypothetical protein